MKSRFLIVAFFLLAILSCKVDPVVTPVLPAAELVETVPPGWPQPVYHFSVNTLSKEKFELGRELFYEVMLSKDNSISCGSCHQAPAAFANTDHHLSHGIDEQVGNRNAPGIFNATWHPYFMHDGGINHIELQPLGPLTNPVEMGESINGALAKLAASAKYRTKFKEAFGSEEVSTQKMTWALAQFMGMMYSYESKYDQVKRGEKNVKFTDAELRGYDRFLANCNTCHTEPLFSDFKFRSNGLKPDAILRDSGRFHVTRQPGDEFKFKTPSLRNVSLTQPYMHDGRLKTLEECVDHYTSANKNLTNLDPLLQNPLNLNAQDKSDLVAFLKTLTDYKFVNDKRFADPNSK